MQTISFNLEIWHNVYGLHITFGGMCSCLRVAVARVFALVVRCRIMRLLLYSRDGKNRDTRREPPAVPGRPVPPATRLSSLARKFSRYGEAIAYTDLLANVTILFNVNKLFYFLNAQFLRLNCYQTRARVVTNR